MVFEKIGGVLRFGGWRAPLRDSALGSESTERHQSITEGGVCSTADQGQDVVGTKFQKGQRVEQNTSNQQNEHETTSQPKNSQLGVERDSQSEDEEKPGSTEKKREPIETAASKTDKEDHAGHHGDETTQEDPEKNAPLQKATSNTPLYTSFTSREKVWIVFMSTMGAFISPLSTNIYFPAIPTLADYYHQSISNINLTLTTYMIFQAIAPMFFSDAADTMGHRPPMIIAYIIYFAANIGCATQTSYPALLVLRCLQSLGSSGTVAIRMAVIAAVITPAERGKYMSWAQVGVLMAPTLAPVLGGLLAQYLGWRAIFWFLVIISGIYLLVYIFAMPETHRGLVGDGSVPAEHWYNRSLIDYHRKKRLSNTTHPDIDKKKTRARFPNPLKCLVLFREPDIAIVLSFSMLQYAAFYDVLTTIPAVYGERYHLNSLEQGLCYIPIGVGAAIAALLNGRIMDWSYRKTAIKHGFPTDRKKKQDIRNFPIEEARLRATLPLMMPGLLTTVCYGWALQYSPLAGPLVLQFIIGASLTSSFTSLSSMLIDLYPQGPAAITAANNLTRCLFGAGATAVIQPMIDGMGLGWTYTFIGLAWTAFTPLIILEGRKGPKYRAARWARLDAEEAEKKARQDSQDISVSKEEK